MSLALIPDNLAWLQTAALQVQEVLRRPVFRRRVILKTIDAPRELCAGVIERSPGLREDDAPNIARRLLRHLPHNVDTQVNAANLYVLWPWLT